MVKKLLLLLSCFSLLVGIHAQETLDDETLQALLESYAEDSDYAVVAYLRYGRAEWQGVDGFADVEQRIEAQTSDLFRLASITKPFVATVMLQLVDEGLVDLDAPIADYLPAEIVENVANTETATVRNMLQMTSGLMDYIETDAYYDAYDEALEATSPRAWTTQELISFIYGEDAYFAAGEDYYYSNTNYILAQIIIEAVTGKSLSEELETRIFTPLGMDSCFLETPDKFAQGIVHGYDADEDVTKVNDGLGFGDGGMVCNAQDLAKFLPALMQGQLMSAAALEAMLTPVDDGEEGLYGLGMGVWEGDFGFELGHDGASSGFQSTMAYNPDEDLVLVILTNTFDSEILWDLAYDIEYTVLDSD